ncbi:30S ribosome-binding factor RbfA [Buchnera aphidicola (Chaitoregma tattakana)]|uniref:30S ribosome-binding factor RbfA n=1 Tax=Buchnera aphidicola TaxID=9 RepID=UPI0031B7F1C8
MAIECNRTNRISTIIRKEISNILYYSINDIRINFAITILDVKVSRDLKYAKIFFTTLAHRNVNSINNIITILNSYKKHIRRILCKKIILRIVPDLCFYYDNSFLKGIKISNLLKKIK